MTDNELAAIKTRIEGYQRDRMAWYTSWLADIEALLTEVERLRAHYYRLHRFVESESE